MKPITPILVVHFLIRQMREQFVEHFDDAQKVVAQWESNQGFEPSEPQWVMGKNMELMLPQLEKSLFPQQSTATSTVPVLAAPMTIAQSHNTSKPAVVAQQ